MESRKLKCWGILCLSMLMMSSMAMALDSGTLDLSKISEPGLKGLFGSLAVGMTTIDGIPFDVKDARARLQPGEKRRIDFAPIKAEGFHFLHFTENAGDRVGAYTLVYADGKRVEIPIRGSLNISDWWKPGELTFSSLAHKDEFKAGSVPQAIGFWRFSVRNPHPELPLVALEIANKDAVVCINLLAASYSATCGEKVGNTPVWVVDMNEEQFFMAVLSQKGAIIGKAKACEELKRVGSVKTVPALAACLEDEYLSHAARLALTAMGFPEAHKALCDALPKTSGVIKAGLIESLGSLRNPEYIPLIVPALNDSDPAVAMSAALALGRIGGSKSMDALTAVAGKGSDQFQRVVLDALLSNAEKLSKKSERKAFNLYVDIYNQFGGKPTFGTAAYEGILRNADKHDAKELFTKALEGTNPVLWDAALPVIRDRKGGNITKLAGILLKTAQKPVLPGLIASLAQRGDKDAAPAIAPFVEDADPVVSAAAIKALALIGDKSSVPVLVKTAAHKEEPNKSAAMQALLQLNDKKISAALLDHMKAADTAETTVLAKVMGQRKDNAVNSALRKLIRSQEAGVRVAAIQALAEVGDAQDAQLLCQAAERTDNKKETAAAKSALITLGKRLGVQDALVDNVLASLNKDNTVLRCAMLGVCGGLRNEKLLQALVKAVGDANTDVKDTAIRTLADTENPDALGVIEGQLASVNDLTYRVLLFRGIARLASNDAIDIATREAVITKAIAAAERPEEKQLLLGTLSKCHTLGALKTAEGYLATKEVVAEAVMAWSQIAKSLLPANDDVIRATAPVVAEKAKEAGLAKEATKALNDVQKILVAVPVDGNQIHFDHTVIDRQFRSEGVAVADVNRDGKKDILVGDYWYEAPTWQPHEIRAPQTYDPNTGYSLCFATFAEDVDGDGWVDSIVIGFPGAPAYWYKNPGATGTGHWQQYLLATAACGETPLYGDLLSDGHPVPVFAMNSRITWYRTGQDKLAPWLAYPISHQMANFAQFGHGLGIGDVNKDGRNDILCTEGWWEGPVDRTRPDWGFHQVKLGPDSANMLVYDVDGDGLNDVISSSAHNYGVWWFKQTLDANGAPTFVQNEIDKSTSQTHALIMADINNDGLQDLITGKRYYAHCGHDIGCNEPSKLYWFELVRPEPGKVEYRKHEIDADSGVGTQFEVCDVDDDGLLDIVTSNKKGVHVFLQRRSK